MARRSSGITLTKEEAQIVLAMAERGDRNHDIACWFGVNQGRIAEAKQGEFGTLAHAPADSLPPSGPPGVKGRRLREALEGAVARLRDGDQAGALAALDAAAAEYDADER